MKELGQAANNVYLHPSPVCHRQVRVQVHVFKKWPSTVQQPVSAAHLATWARLQKCVPASLTCLSQTGEGASTHFQQGAYTQEKLVSGAQVATWARLSKMCTCIPHLSVTDR